jgi:large subunit ribosomal protein L21e
MVKKSNGLRRHTRRKFKSEVRSKFKVTPYLREFRISDKVAVKVDPSSQKGLPGRRFKGKIGIVKEKRGDSYVIEISDGNMKKTVISRPEHLVLKK